MPADEPFSQPPDEYTFMAPNEIVFPFHEDEDGEMVDEVAHEDGHDMNNVLEQELLWLLENPDSEHGKGLVSW